MAVADGETFDRLHPLAVPSDANAVAVMFEVPSPWKIASVVDVYSLPVGVLKTSTIQFDPSDDGCTLTPIACGVPPVGVSRPDTITYSTAASTTVMATIRMVAITGDTAASCFRMMLFMVLSSCGLRRHWPGAASDSRHAAVALPRPGSRPLLPYAPLFRYSPDVDTHHTRSLTRGRQQAGYHHV